MLHIHTITSPEVTNSSLLAKTKRSVRTHGLKAIKALGIRSDVTITVYPKADWTIKETGETGYTPTGDWIQATVDLTGKTHAIETVISERLPATIYHEMCHIRRWQTTGFGSTFHEELISEGLSCAFEMEMWKHDIEPLFLATHKEIEKLLKIVHDNKERIRKNYSYFDWFTRGDKDIPRWLGYKLGYYVVHQALLHNPEMKVSDLMTLSAADILKMSKIKV